MKRVYMLLFTAMLFLSGCSQKDVPMPPVEATQPPIPIQTTEAVQESTGKRLQISLESTDDATYKHLSANFPEGITDFEITYHDVTNVMIALDGKLLALEDALKSGQITPEEIIAYAQLDARDNYCFEYATSKNGLTKLVYNYYDQFDLVVVYDVYETPDGKQHLIKQLYLCPYYDGRRISFGYGDIDREDWGLTFEPAAVTSTGLTLRVTQKHGQQIGTLHIAEYALVDQTTQLTLKTEDTDPFTSLNGQPGYIIDANGVTDIKLDWSAVHGDLPSGTYTLVLHVFDEYDESQVHPLMKNFEDSQMHYVAFSVP